MSNTLKNILAFLLTIVLGITVGSALAISDTVDEKMRKHTHHSVRRVA